MKNIFENAYFGKVYKTRDGRKAIYWNYTEGGRHELIFDTGTWMCYNNDGRYSKSIEDKIDIVSEWQEEINEEELKIKAQRAAMKYHPKERESDDPEMDSIIRNVYMDCYIDCFNELNGGKNDTYSR